MKTAAVEHPRKDPLQIKAGATLRIRRLTLALNRYERQVSHGDSKYSKLDCIPPRAKSRTR